MLSWSLKSIELSQIWNEKKKDGEDLVKVIRGEQWWPLMGWEESSTWLWGAVGAEVEDEEAEEREDGDDVDELFGVWRRR